ncbi:outer membrane lipoprotein-sorting protein [Riemerella anatipestifer]|uniref:outer membrane lipoprotein-sorting protein n=1 Tax=Riemerella anatipestifer TaxID=34085 RepID=UPI00129D7FC5|nr:outer membrane lipoprotein-sorting protein [Riemerella anatipestifer]MDY3319284.1 outer membrane lipoprotein-sorting protein [Riemerella anatipestifer]MDY3325500.1 outer membrane lipoprotein-sorting protein [Riemerella anatipestifer]MDY3354097.1 outer membrane lipoprotein-sorting protein [Riemerella anatipestifer]MRM84158.1 histidine kinase [Riemerella anatipestifer]
MIKKIALVVLLALAQVFYAQTAKEIIDKNIELTGGLTKWKLLNSIMLQGKVVLGIQEEYPIKIYQQRPNLTKTSIIINNKESVIEAYDGKKGYAMNYANNKLQEFENYQPQSFDTDFIDFEAKGFTAVILGKDKVGERLCYKVELTKNVNKTLYYFDTENYMLLKEVKKGETLLYSDFKKVNGLTMPFRIEASTPKKEGDYVMLFNKIEVNKAFPDNTFKIK